MVYACVWFTRVSILMFYIFIESIIILKYLLFIIYYFNESQRYIM